ncbi:MAG: ATP-binding protein [Planctomycetaceae bacterium]|jgi:ABC-type dipeptide/oligopeptide/nickel transport system ATPase component|nr:ATP-binding protein [Planctomycetaceae bacterium]
MKILNFQFEDRIQGWHLEKMSFNDNLTLLVGASGVGKTMILNSLLQLQEIALGFSYSGVNWNIEFETLNGQHYQWEGSFENGDLNIKYEKLVCDGELVADRDGNDIQFNREQTPKLSRHESILSLFKEENSVKPAHDGFIKMKLVDCTNPVHHRKELIKNWSSLQSGINSFEKIQNCNLPNEAKLYFLGQINQDLFHSIQEQFIEIFPFVRAFKSVSFGMFPDEDTVFFKIQIREEGVDHYITKISSGMYRVLMQLCNLYLCPEGTVFLIDEFENSLGINCIQEITQEILSPERQLQFIVTSHHPYIINNIPCDYWKLVTRHGGTVKTHTLSDLGVDFKKSHHEAFMQLMQLDEFRTGQEQKK